MMPVVLLSEARALLGIGGAPVKKLSDCRRSPEDSPRCATAEGDSTQAPWLKYDMSRAVKRKSTVLF